MTLVQNNFLYFYSMFIEMSSMYRHLKVSTMSWHLSIKHLVYIRLSAFLSLWILVNGLVRPVSATPRLIYGIGK